MGVASFDRHDIMANKKKCINKTYQLAEHIKPRLHERFFARAGDAIFSNFVASPARDENRTCSHP